MAMLGVLAGLLYAVGGLFYDLILGGGLNYGTLLAFMALVAMPIMFGGVGLLAGVVHALLCNATTKVFGVEFDLRKG